MSEPAIRKGHKVFCRPEKDSFYGAKVVYVGKNHYRLEPYYNIGLGRHNRPKEQVSLQDGQY